MSTTSSTGVGPHRHHRQPSRRRRCRRCRNFTPNTCADQFLSHFRNDCTQRIHMRAQHGNRNHLRDVQQPNRLLRLPNRRIGAARHRYRQRCATFDGFVSRALAFQFEPNANRRKRRIPTTPTCRSVLEKKTVTHSGCVSITGRAAFDEHHSCTRAIGMRSQTGVWKYIRITYTPENVRRHVRHRSSVRLLARTDVSSSFSVRDIYVPLIYIPIGCARTHTRTHILNLSTRLNSALLLLRRRTDVDGDG